MILNLNAYLHAKRDGYSWFTGVSRWKYSEHFFRWSEKSKDRKFQWIENSSDRKIRQIISYVSLKIRYFLKSDISVNKKDFCSNSARCLHQSENVPARCLCLGADSSITFGSQCQYSLPLIAILFISSLCIFIIVIIAAFIIKVCIAYSVDKLDCKD